MWAAGYERRTASRRTTPDGGAGAPRPGAVDQCLWRVRKDPPYLDAYFTCISHPGPREPTLGVLNAIAFAHASTIPSENLDVLLGRPMALDSASLVDKLVRQRRSG